MLRILVQPRLAGLARLWTLSLLALAFACHDSPRSNPLDPELTPPVELSVVANGSTGTILLSWTSYSGETPFAAYRVLRRVSGLEKVDTVATLSQQAQTTWQDSLVTQGQTYIYQVAVVNSAGLVVTSAWAVASALELTPVVLATAVDSRRAAITIHWSSYLGPRFASYRVVRMTPDGGEAVVFATTDPTTTACTDTGLAGNTSYRYRVEVVTTGQGTVQSREVTGQFHELVAFWPLEVSDEDVILAISQG